MLYALELNRYNGIALASSQSSWNMKQILYFQVTEQKLDILSSPPVRIPE